MTAEIAEARVKRLVDSGLRGTCRPKERLLQLAGDSEAINEAPLRKVESLFSALGDFTRLRVLELVTKEQELCSCELMAALRLTQPTTSHHLGILERAGLLRSRREGKWVFYQLANPAIKLILTKSMALVQEGVK